MELPPSGDVIASDPTPEQVEPTSSADTGSAQPPPQDTDEEAQEAENKRRRLGTLSDQQLGDGPAMEHSRTDDRAAGVGAVIEVSISHFPDRNRQLRIGFEEGATVLDLKALIESNWHHRPLDEIRVRHDSCGSDLEDTDVLSAAKPYVVIGVGEYQSAFQFTRGSGDEGADACALATVARGVVIRVAIWYDEDLCVWGRYSFEVGATVSTLKAWIESNWHRRWHRRIDDIIVLQSFRGPYAVQGPDGGLPPVLANTDVLTTGKDYVARIFDAFSGRVPASPESLATHVSPVSVPASPESMDTPVSPVSRQPHAPGEKKAKNEPAEKKTKNEPAEKKTKNEPADKKTKNVKLKRARMVMCEVAFDYTWEQHRQTPLPDKIDQFREEKNISRRAWQKGARVIGGVVRILDISQPLTEDAFPVHVVCVGNARALKGGRGKMVPAVV